jgi:hypothetical protein
MKKSIQTLIAAATVSFGVMLQAQAATFCTYSVGSIAVRPDGTLVAHFGSDPQLNWFPMCNLNGTLQAQDGIGNTMSISSKVCEAWYAKLLTARSSNRAITFAFQPDGLNCANRFAWALPNPYPYWMEML